MLLQNSAKTTTITTGTSSDGYQNSAKTTTITTGTSSDGYQNSAKTTTITTGTSSDGYLSYNYIEKPFLKLKNKFAIVKSNHPINYTL